MLVKSFISTKFQVSDSPRMVPEAGLMRPCPQEHMRPIGSISPGAIAHDRLGSARRVRNLQLVCVSGGFQAAHGRNACATSTNIANRASLPIPKRLYLTSLRNLSKQLPWQMRCVRPPWPRRTLIRRLIRGSLGLLGGPRDCWGLHPTGQLRKDARFNRSNFSNWFL